MVDLEFKLAAVYQSNYEKSDNSFWVWEAIKILGKDRDYPEWIREYLINVATDLIEIDSPEKGFYKMVCDIIGMKANKLTANHISKRNTQIGHAVWETFQNNPNIKKGDCYEIVGAEFSISADMVGRIYNKSKGYFDIYRGRGK